MKNSIVDIIALVGVFSIAPILPLMGLRIEIDTDE